MITEKQHPRVDLWPPHMHLYTHGKKQNPKPELECDSISVLNLNSTYKEKVHMAST